MKVILKFKNGTVKEKELPESTGVPEKIMFHATDPEIHGYLLQMSKDQQGTEMSKMDGILFKLSHEENETPTYTEGL